MILEGNFIQKEGARKVPMGIIVFLMTFLALAMIPFQYEKMVVHKKFWSQEWTKFSLCW